MYHCETFMPRNFVVTSKLKYLHIESSKSDGVAIINYEKKLGEKKFDDHVYSLKKFIYLSKKRIKPAYKIYIKINTRYNL